MENRASVKASDYMDKFKEHIKDIIKSLHLYMTEYTESRMIT